MEATVFRRKIAHLQTGVQDDVDNFALRLYEKGLIGQATCQKATLGSTPSGQRASVLLLAVENGIRTKPADFHTVIEILGSFHNLSHLVGPLESEFQQLRDIQHAQHSESLSYSEVVATTPSSSLPYSGDRSVLVQRLPSPPRPLVTDFRNVSAPELEAWITHSEQPDGGQRPSRSSTAGDSSAGESEDFSTVFQQSACELSMPGASLLVIPPGIGEYSSEKFKQEVQQKFHEAGDTLSDLHTFIVANLDQYRSDEITQLESQVGELQLSKVEDAQHYEKKVADTEEAMKQLRTILHTVTLQLEHKDKKITAQQKKITAQKADIFTLKEDAKISQAEKEKSQAEAKEKEKLINQKERELQAEQTEKQQLESELKEAQKKFKELEEKYCNLQKEVKSRKRKTKSWPIV